MYIRFAHHLQKNLNMFFVLIFYRLH